MMPRISMVTPSFNQARFLEATMRSVLGQCYEALDYVVIDGGSTDGSMEIIQKYSPQLSYWVSEPDGGHGNALNKGFARTTGEIMGWLNSDDLHFPWTLALVGEIFSTFPEVQWLTAHANAIFDEKGRLWAANRTLSNKYDYLLHRISIQQESTFWRRSLWDATGGRIAEDYVMVDGELWSRFFLHARLYHVTCALGGFRRWGGNRSILHHDICNKDMARCVGIMERSLDAQTLANAQILKRSPKEAINDARYDLIASRNGAWKLQSSPFR
jgi:glycosyltransferase involved in cell wall biosynthesis